VISLREVQLDDLETLYEHSTDPVSQAMAVFGAREHDAFMDHWQNRILVNPDGVARAIVLDDGTLVGNIISWLMDGKRYLGYWLGREFWGRGYGSEALRQFVEIVTDRPLWALVVVANIGSQRVLEHGGFKQVERRMSPHDGIEEFVYRLD
jgi:RimJ/RimL family protein N-acetyltransferase